MKTRLFNLVGFALLVPFIIGGCASSKSITYLRDMQYEAKYVAKPAPELKFQPEDRISVSIYHENAQLIAPFYKISDISKVESGLNDRFLEFVVDRDGNIDFPIVGQLNIAGKTEKEVKNLITRKIQETGFIKNPDIKVELNGFDIAIIGNVGNRIIHVEKGKSFNLFEALATASGITHKSKIKDVMVIRTENGVREAFKINLRSKDLYDSPAFYLHQNDVIYIKPRGNQLSTDGQMALSLIGSTVSIMTTIFLYIRWAK